jgi:hypothetical protein
MSTTPHDMSEEIAKLLNSFGHKVALNHRNSTEGYAKRRQEDDIFADETKSLLLDLIHEREVGAVIRELQELNSHPYWSNSDVSDHISELQKEKG